MKAAISSPWQHCSFMSEPLLSKSGLTAEGLVKKGLNRTDGVIAVGSPELSQRGIGQLVIERVGTSDLFNVTMDYFSYRVRLRENIVAAKVIDFVGSDSLKLRKETQVVPAASGIRKIKI